MDALERVAREVQAPLSIEGQDFRLARERFVDTLGIIARSLKSGEVSSEGSKFYDFPPMPLTTGPLQEPIPFWYPGNPETAGRYGMNLMWPGPVPLEAYETYLEAWEKHKGGDIRLDGPNSQPTVAASMIISLDAESGAALSMVAASLPSYTLFAAVKLPMTSSGVIEALVGATDVSV